MFDLLCVCVCLYVCICCVAPKCLPTQGPANCAVCNGPGPCRMQCMCGRDTGITRCVSLWSHMFLDFLFVMSGVRHFSVGRCVPIATCRSSRVGCLVNCVECLVCVLSSVYVFVRACSYTVVRIEYRVMCTIQLVSSRCACHGSSLPYIKGCNVSATGACHNQEC